MQNSAFPNRRTVTDWIQSPASNRLPWTLFVLAWLVAGYVPGLSESISLLPWYPSDADDTGLAFGVLAAVTAVVIALAVFIAQKSRLGQTSLTVRSIVRHLGIAPVLTLAMLLPFVILLRGQASIADGLILLILASGALFMVSRFFVLIRDPHCLKDIRSASVRIRTRIAIYDLVRIRRSSEQLSAWLNLVQPKVEISLGTPDSEERFRSVQTDRDCLVVGLQYQSVDAAAALLARSSVAPVQEHSSETSDQSPVYDSTPRRPVILLHAVPGKSLRAGEMIASYASHEDLDSGTESKILDHLSGSLKTDDQLMKRNLEFQDDIDEIEEEILSALDSGHPALVSSALELYVDAAKEAIRTLERLGFERELEPGGFTVLWTLGRSGATNRFLETCRRFLDYGLDPKRAGRDIVFEVAGIPIRIAYAALESRNIGLARDFLSLQTRLIEGSFLLSGDRQAFLVDRSWRFVTEFITSLTSKLSDSPDDAKQLAPLFLACFTTYSEMLRACIDELRITDTRVLLHSLSNIHVLETDSLTRRSRYRRHGTEAVVAVLDTADVWRWGTVIGLTAWTIRTRKDDPVPSASDTIVDMLLSTLPDDPQVCVRVLELAFGHEGHDPWGWGRWEDSISPEGKVHRVETSDWLQRAIALKFVHTANKSPARHLDPIDLKGTPGVAHFAKDESSPIRTFLEQLRDGSTRWAAVIGDGVADSAGAVLHWLHLVVQQEEERLRAEVRGSHIDPELVLQFTDAVVASRRSSYLVFEVLTRGEEPLTAEKPIERSSAGLYRSSIVPKELFLPDSQFPRQGVAEDLGHGLAGGEDVQLFRRLIGAAGDPHSCESPNQLFALINEHVQAGGQTAEPSEWVLFASPDFVSDLDLFGPRPGAVAADTVALFGRSLDMAFAWIPCGSTAIPVFEIMSRTSSEAVLVPVNSFGRVVRQIPVPGASYDGARVTEGVLFWIRDLDRDAKLRGEIVASDPAWLGGSSPEEREEHLFGQVLLEVRADVSLELGRPHSIFWLQYDAKQDQS